jgi:hypothetical protein
MVPRVSLIEAMCDGATPAVGIATTEDALLDVLEVVADAYWSISGSFGVSTGFFLDSFGLSRLSGFVHWQISRQLRDDAARPT